MAFSTRLCRVRYYAAWAIRISIFTRRLSIPALQARHSLDGLSGFGTRCRKKKDCQMNSKNSLLNNAPMCELASHIHPFIVDLKNAGYPDSTVSTKHAALRKFISWRSRRMNASAEPDESEVKTFMANACQLTAAHRSLASTALLGFLNHLRRLGVIRSRSPKNAATPTSRLVQSYIDFLHSKRHAECLFPTAS